jgi:hypothetical protein
MTSRPTSPRPDLERIGLTGVYIWTEANPPAPFRPLREVQAKFPPLAAQRAVLKKSSDDPLTFAEIEQNCSPHSKVVQERLGPS